MSPATGIVGPKTSVLPMIWSQPTISGSASPANPNRSSSSSSHVTESSEINSDRLAVDASVTNAPHSRFTSQVSVVLTTPALVMFARIHAIFGAEKYGSSTSPVRCATDSADCDSGVQIDSARGVAVPRQDGFALVGQRDGGDGNTGLRQGLSARVDDRVEQCDRVLLDAAARQILGSHRDLGDRDDLPGVVDNDRLRARGALVDCQEVLHRQSFAASASISASIDAIPGMVSPCFPRVASR